MTSLMQMIQAPKLFKVNARVSNTQTKEVLEIESYHVDAHSREQAEDKVMVDFFNKGYDQIVFHDVSCLERVGDYKVVLVLDEQA